MPVDTPSVVPTFACIGSCCGNGCLTQIPTLPPGTAPQDPGNSGDTGNPQVIITGIPNGMMPTGFDMNMNPGGGQFNGDIMGWIMDQMKNIMGNIGNMFGGSQ
jgi:hypothetical protein